MKWTEQQLQAINVRGKNLLVAAAAGSGKTAVLAERIVQMIIEKVCDVDEMLIVTFTNAAAQEMRTRIHAKIEEKILSETDPKLIARLERQAILLSGAFIMTFHAFCLSVIKRNFSKIDLDPKFREADERELNILKQEIIEELFEEKYLQAENNSDKDFINFADNFGGDVKGDSSVCQTILNLHKTSCSRPYPELWLDTLADNYKNPAWIDELLKVALIEVKNIICSVYETCGNCLDECYRLEKISAQFAGNVANLESDFAYFKNLYDNRNDWDKLFEIVGEGFKFTTWSSKKAPAELVAQKNSLKARRDEYKKKIEKLKNLLENPKAEIISEIENLAAPVRQLTEITKEFDKKFSAAKRERGIIDFPDMEHLALKIFNTSAQTAENYRNRFKVVMVDEYQDTNDVQEEIIGKIIRENNFFAVGDVKQSIYKFRNAAPEIFLQKYKTYPELENCERVDLSKNFRSREQVVDSVNAIFRKIMREDALEIEYSQNAELNFGAGEIGDYPEGENIFADKTELSIIVQNNNNQNLQNTDDNNFSAEDSDKLGREIQVIADKIKFMFESKKQIWDRKLKKYRDIKFRDIVILMRATEGKTTKILDVLARNNIPAYAEDKFGYFKAQEVQTILNFLNVLDNARQDIPLAAVMLSPLGNFSAEDLANLRINDRNSDLYTLTEKKSATDDELGAKCKDFLNRINYWRTVAIQLSVPELLSKIYRETGYYDYFDNPGGKMAQANLRVLIDRAADYEKTAFRGLSRFIQFIRKMRELKNDLASARTLGESEDLVRIMTIHKSKGLEFPIVFVAELGKSFNTQDLRKSVITHRNLGIGICRVVEGDSGINYLKTFPQKIIAEKMRVENLAEELRILYVAMTRAQEKLFLVATCTNNLLTKFDRLENISAQNIQSATHALDWLLMIKNSFGNSIDLEILQEEEIFLRNEKISIEEEKISAPIEKAENFTENIPAKLSVTEIKRRLAEVDENFSDSIYPAKKFITMRRPNFIQKKSLSGAELGTLLHSVMQHLNLKKNLDEKNIVAQIDEMVAKKIFEVEHGENLKNRAGDIAKFFTSNIGKKILSAEKIYRELPFNQYISAKKIGGGKIFNIDEKIFIQGIIDVLFQTRTGEWILLDYKTDRDNSDEHFIREYRDQIYLYVQAIETLLKITISEKYLYLLSAGREIKIS